jgi:Zn-dependent M28 family amino/carboxypeptidase
MRKRNIITLILIAVLVWSPLTLQAQTKSTKTAVAVSARGNVEGITAAQMKDYLTFIAADELEGRDTPSRGLDIAALFIATHLARWGLKPGGEQGTYFQPFALRRAKIDSSLSNASLGNHRFSYGEDFLAQLQAGSSSGALVYVSHGWVIKAKNINAYEGIDVKDKILVAHNSLPKGVTFNDLIGGKQGEDWANAQIYAQQQGAKGVVIIPDFQTLAGWETSRRNAVERGAISLAEPPPPSSAQPASSPQIPTIAASVKLLTALFQGERHTATTIFNRFAAGDPVAAFDLNPDKKFSFSVAVKNEPATAKNVIAVLEGSDPVLKNEYVAIGAHYDHVGIGAPDKTGDTLYNGADDDGSGTVAVMAMAEAFAKGPRPKRSILFIWHAGEEKGLWGAQYFTNRPTVPIKGIITQLNIDMIGRSKRAGDTNPANKDLAHPGEIFVIGSKMMSSELGEVSEEVNRSYLNLGFNYKYDDPKDPNRFFFRSDHFYYAQKGIPIIFYMDGEHEDYHKPSDSVEKIDFEQMEKVTRTIYATAWELAHRVQRPRVDKQLPAELTGQ